MGWAITSDDTVKLCTREIFFAYKTDGLIPHLETLSHCASGLGIPVRGLACEISTVLHYAKLWISIFLLN